MNRTTQVVDQDRHLHVLFIAQQPGRFRLLPQGAVRGDDFTWMSFANIHKEEFDVIAAETLIKLVDADDGMGRHGAGGGAERQKNVLLAGEVLEPDRLGLQADSLEIRGSLTRSGTRKRSLGQIVKDVAGKVLVIVAAEAQHFYSW